MTPTLDIENLQVTYALGGGPIAAVRDVSLAVRPHECVGIVGESGSGKTQVFLAAMGLLPKNARTGGKVRFDGREMLGLSPQALNRWRGSKLTMIFQDPMTSLTPHLRIGVQMGEVLVSHRGASWRNAQSEALRMLERVRVPEPQAAPAAISARTVRRNASAGDDRHEPAGRARSADRGRADHRA